MKKVLVTGGAGYIGSHTCKFLSEQNITPVVLDNLSTGFKEFVQWGPFYQGDIGDVSILHQIFDEHQIDAVFHFAGLINVRDSFEQKELYYENNVTKSRILIDEVFKRTDKFIFSSTCATYGDPKYLPIDEEHPQNPKNPYGENKLEIEKYLLAQCENLDKRVAILRYFNAAGADFDGLIGESHRPETHLIPLAIKASLDDTFSLELYGNDYDTHDGTCIRDFIHVSDLARAHYLALEKLDNDKVFVSNVGTGIGHSVLDIIHEVERITRKKVKYSIRQSRPEDSERLVSCNRNLSKKLKITKFCSLNQIIQSAYNWHQNQSISIN